MIGNSAAQKKYVHFIRCKLRCPLLVLKYFLLLKYSHREARGPIVVRQRGLTAQHTTRHAAPELAFHGADHGARSQVPDSHARQLHQFNTLKQASPYSLPPWAPCVQLLRFFPETLVAGWNQSSSICPQILTELEFSQNFPIITVYTC